MRKLLNLLRHRSLDADIQEELEFHRSQTGGSFGNATRIHEQIRDESTVIWLESLLGDIRYGLRQLARTPVLVTIAILSLALGIGANTAVFTLINAIMLQWLPVQDPARLVLFYDGIGTGNPAATVITATFFRTNSGSTPTPTMRSSPVSARSVKVPIVW